ncbi:MAG: hypothetical protein LIQ31_09970 [Planctomycetes bacterium]|nr:hypothetical protein [Planctomycetota bacterium]
MNELPYLCPPLSRNVEDNRSNGRDLLDGNILKCADVIPSPDPSRPAGRVFFQQKLMNPSDNNRMALFGQAVLRLSRGIDAVTRFSGEKPE